MPIRATTLIRDIQNSTSPKAPTWMRLMAVITSRQTRAVTQCGCPGNQKSMNTPAAVSSSMPTTMQVNHQFHPEMNPAMGPMNLRA